MRRDLRPHAVVLAGVAALSAAAAPLPAGPRPAEQEQALVREACRYLRLSAAQVTRLLALARQTERARLLAEQEARRVEEALAPRAQADPSEAERLQKLMDERREESEHRIVAFAGAQVVRLLTREQIALAWRLHQGSPPKYAAAHPSLLEGQAGFVRGTRLLRSSRLAVQAPAAIAPDVHPGELVEHARPQNGAARPFLQRVAESRDPAEFVAEIEPFTRRLFLSPRLAAALQPALKTGFAPAERPVSGPLRLVRDYQFERGLRDLTGHGPELEPMGGAVEHGMYHFGPGQGLRLTSAGVTDHYALDISFRHFGGAGYQKLVDFKNGTADGGLYLYQGRLTFYTLAEGGAPAPGAEHRLRLERSRTTRVVRAFLDWRPMFAFLDLDDEAVFAEGRSLLFVDDRTTRDEHGPGAVRSVRLWEARGAAPGE